VKTILLESNYLNKTIELEKKIHGVPFSSIDKNNLSCILLDDEEVVGSISYRYAYDDSDILFFCIDEEYRGRGLSIKLFNDSLVYLKERNIKNIYLEVDELNTIAINLYTKLGFTQISRREKYYQNKSDAIVMIKKIC